MSKRLDNCKQCGVLLNDSNSVWSAPKSSWGERRRYNSCHECHVKQHRARKADNNFQKNYGINSDDYYKMNIAQNGLCAICRRMCNKHTRLSVDHDHKNGQVRGLLCHRCNTAIGMLEDNEDIIWNLLEYLKKHTWSKVS